MSDDNSHKPKLQIKRRATTDKKEAPPLQSLLNTRIKSNPLIKKFNLPATETLLDDFSCALSKQILLHGKMYISDHYVCFESKLFGIKTLEVVRFVDIKKILKRSKEFKFRFFGIHIITESQSYSFASFASRDKAYALLQQTWLKSVPDANCYSDDEDDDSDEGDDSAHQLTNTASITSQDKSSGDEDEKGKTRRVRARSFIKAALNRTSSKGSIDRPKDMPGGLTPAASNESTSVETTAATSSAPVPIVAAASQPIAIPVDLASTPPTVVGSYPESTDSREAVVEETVDCLISEGESLSDDEGFLEAEDSQFHQVINDVLDISVVNFFRAFFSDRSNFTRFYHEHRGDRDITVKLWTNSEQFGMIRDVTYVAPLKMTIGPDKTRIQETQRYHLQKNKLTFETVTNMLDIPYGDFFRMEANWQVSSVSDSQCKVVVKIGCHFMKKTWFKSKIESSGIKESEKSYGSWIALAHKELEKPEFQLLVSTRAATNPTVSAGSSEPSKQSAPPPPAAPATVVVAAPSSSTPVEPAPSGIVKGTPSSSSPKTKDTISSASGNPFAPLQNINTTTLCIAFVCFLVLLYFYGKMQYLEGRVVFMEGLLKEGLRCQMPPHQP